MTDSASDGVATLMELQQSSASDGTHVYVMKYPPSCMGGDEFMQSYQECSDALLAEDAPFALLHDASALEGWASFDRRLIRQLVADARAIAAQGRVRRAAFLIDKECEGFWHRSIGACVRRLSPVKPTETFVDQLKALKFVHESPK